MKSTNYYNLIWKRESGIGSINLLEDMENIAKKESE